MVARISMSTRFVVPGFPKDVGPVLDIAPIGELLVMPMFRRARWELFQRKASPYQRELAAKAPLHGGHPHVYVDCCVQFLQPGVSALGTRGGYGLGEWHLDGIARGGDPPSVFHAFTSPCTAQTEFNTKRVSLSLRDDRIETINAELGKRGRALPLAPRAMPAGRFVTFTTHVHRAAAPKHREFRFFFRITESSLMAPVSDDQAIVAYSIVHDETGVRQSVDQHPDRIVVHLR